MLRIGYGSHRICISNIEFYRYVSIRSVSLIRRLHASRRHMLNPLLPFDVVEEVENDDLTEKNEKLKKEKKILMKQRKNLRRKMNSEKQAKEDNKYYSKNDTIPKAKAVAQEVKTTEVTEKTGIVEDREHAPFEDKTKKSASNGDASAKKSEDAGSDNPRYKSATDTGSNSASATSVGGSGVGGSGGGGGNGNDDEKVLPDEDKGDEKKEPSSESDASKKDEPKQGEDNEKNEGKKDTDKETKDEGSEESKKAKEDEVYDEMLEEERPNKFKEWLAKFGRFLFKCLETAGITFSSIGILGFAGILYHKFYGENVLLKIDQAFDEGDPAYQLAVHRRTDKNREQKDSSLENLSKYWVERPQQKLIDDIVSGKISGRYFLLIGEKGTGKTSLLLEAMKKVDGFNVAILDAHADPEIFRIRLGKALNYAYSEDYIGSLFSIRGPRDTTALLDIERAFGKLEELAIKRINKTGGKPMVLIINNAHLIKENEEGIQLIELLQQKAENLSGSGLVTTIFNSDDYWIYEKLKKLGTRLELINVRDFNRGETKKALQFVREKHYPSSKFPDLRLNEDKCNEIYDLIGGRPQHISQVARHRDIIRACHEIIDREKTWLLNQCGLLGKDMDDDVMESGKFATSAMLLMKEFVEMSKNSQYKFSPTEHAKTHDDLLEHILPELPLWRARQIMTRADYIQQYDNLNIFTIDSESRVRADSVPMMRAFYEIVTQSDFDALLQETMSRVADIESLGRTRELILKDLNYGSRYLIAKESSPDLWSVCLKKSATQLSKEDDVPDTEEESDDLLLESINREERKKWWNKRMNHFDLPYSHQPSPTPQELDLSKD